MNDFVVVGPNLSRLIATVIGSLLLFIKKIILEHSYSTILSMFASYRNNYRE